MSRAYYLRDPYFLVLPKLLNQKKPANMLYELVLAHMAECSTEDGNVNSPLDLVASFVCTAQYAIRLAMVWLYILF